MDRFRQILEPKYMLKISFLILFMALSACVVYPDGRVAGAYDERAIHSELARCDKEQRALYHQLMHGADSK
jgi:hypothetical protein